jgi:hypothetical protein
MSSKQQDCTTAIQSEAIKCEMIEGLQHAIDRNYRRLFEAANHQWEQNFAGKDPSDACVSVRISAVDVEARPVPASGFLPTRKSSGQKTNRKLPLPHFAG